MSHNTKALYDHVNSFSTHGSIRDLIASGDNRADNNRNEAEERAGASLPGDAVAPDVGNKYLRLACSRPLQVKALVQSGTLSPSDHQDALDALEIYGVLDGQSIWGQRRP